MHLVSADIVTTHDQEMQRLLDEYPELKYHLTILVNSLRERVYACMEAMDEGCLDTADVLRATAKDEAVMRRLGIPVLTTLEGWEEIRKQ